MLKRIIKNGWFVFFTILVIFVVYTWIMGYELKEIISLRDLPVDKRGVFGDSFGVLTALFSALAFGAFIITLWQQQEDLTLQRKEAKENRKEFAKSTEAQQRNAQLSALSSLLSEYKSQIAINEKTISDNESRQMLDGVTFTIDVELEAENKDLIKRKEKVIVYIERILEESGINLEK